MRAHMHTRTHSCTHAHAHTLSKGSLITRKSTRLFYRARLNMLAVVLHCTVAPPLRNAITCCPKLHSGTKSTAQLVHVSHIYHALDLRPSLFPLQSRRKDRPYKQTLRYNSLHTQYSPESCWLSTVTGIQERGSMDCLRR